MEIEILYADAESLANEVKYFIKKMSDCECTTIQQVIQIDNANIRRMDLLSNAAEQIEIKALEIVSAKETEIWKQKSQNLNKLIQELRLNNEKAKALQIKFIDQKAIEERELLFGGDEEAIKRRRNQLRQRDVQKETTETLRVIKNTMGMSLETTRQAQTVLKESSDTIKTSMKKSSQFSEFVGKAREAMSGWWKSLSREDQWYYGSLILFFVVVGFIWIRRIPVRSIFHVISYLIQFCYNGIMRGFGFKDKEQNITEDISSDLKRIINADENIEQTPNLNILPHEQENVIG
ncbi:uncharacterized protein MONOS_4347 [Monocercomonoides exilis]|uniref:uncharacterized protein n=1 Tax=Monocercomonoides exilis TaxID=2049356 RepID=UPI00355A7AE9|nr:hypothetical protein MONOS_4347 [Monocercomonoides exilis]|eukprot:MONOS_4347.1-p1 / transcript=MONOS_4347.1 / gene=MONOS_4347 / organism=Monocercomonoides_exilis_PA203 / gene_product=unspecified product / transcript_product=unspecified product / location=Mono_scaffold00114:81517-82568(-) / protein_length=292 / sequence_SO=supercontig / SO=protein_coding / is_pseudo=false